MLIALGALCTSSSFAVTLTVGDQNQPIRYGLDYERLWYWYGSGLGDVPQWSVNDCDIDFIRTAMNSGYELTEGEYDLSAYTKKILPMMTAMRAANPDIKWFASPRPLNEAVSGASWQPYPLWVTGASSYTAGDYDFDATKCAEYMIRYLLLMKSYGFKISYMDLTNEWQSNYASGGRFAPDDAVTIKQVFDDYLLNPWPHPALDSNLLLQADDFPLMIGSSGWNYDQGGQWISKFTTTARRDAIDIASCHNTDPTGSAQSFADDARAALGDDVEIWSTEMHDWKSTSNFNEVTSFSYMTEAIRAGFTALSGWLAIGTTNQGHAYFLNNGSTVTRNVKYYIFKKLSNSSNNGHAYDINLPAELESTVALVKDDLLTVWVINSSTSAVSTEVDIGNHSMGSSTIHYTQWNESLSVEGVEGSVAADSAKTFTLSVAAESVYCFEVDISEAAPAELVAEWDFDDGSGTTAADSTGSGYNGSIVNPSWVSGVEGTALALDGASSQVTIPGAAFSSIDDEISISLWASGDNSMPVSNSVFYAVNSTGGRILSVHLPWSDSTVYWDAGDSGYDRISKTATTDEIKNSWAHWVFTKNANTGDMKIYRNGALWHSGTGKTKTMTSIVSGTIGSQTSGAYYTGNIDEVQLYSDELSVAEVAALYASYSHPQPPVFSADSYALSNAAERVTYSDSIASTATDPEGDTLSYSKISGPAWLSVASNGALTGAPSESDFGLNTWTVLVNDGQGGSDTATLTVTVDAIANKDGLATIEAEVYDDQSGISTQTSSEGGLNVQSIQNGDWTAYINVDFDDGVNTFEARVASDTSGGLIEIRLDSPTGTLVGTCEVDNTTGWQAWETVNTSIDDISGVQDIYLVFTGGSGYLFNLNWFAFSSIQNSAPIATPASSSVNEDSSQAITLTGSDVDGDALTASIVTQPSHGSLSLAGNVATYTPVANYNGSDSFTFTVNDGTVDSAAATVSISVLSVNDAPVASAQSVSTSEDTAKAITLSGSDLDGDSLSFSILSLPSKGTLSGSGANRTYTPNANANGSDSFTFRANDGTVNSASAVVSISVSAVNDAPEFDASSYTSLDADVGIAYSASFEDVVSDVDGDGLVYSKQSGPDWLIVSETGELSGMPTVADAGLNSWVLQVSDGNGGTATAVLEITVNMIQALVAQWAMDEVAGTQVADVSGNGFNATAVDCVAMTGVNGSALDFNGSTSRVTLPSEAFGSVSSEITIALWAFGDSTMPKNNSVVYATNGSGNRLLNVHLPWSNSQVYWDAGDSSGYDRINKTASASEYKDGWNHWIFTKNVSSGVMNIYLNGSLWHTGTGKSKSIGQVTSATIGGQITSLSYDGVLDDVLLYNFELTAAEVVDLYNSYSADLGAFSVSADIGSLAAAGGVAHADGVYTVEGSGADIYGTQDSFHYVYKDHSADGELIARVDSVQNTNTWAKAGVMFRETDADDSSEVMLLVRPDNQVSMQYRASAGAASTSLGLFGDTLNVKWIKLVRDGDLFSGYISLDGEGWTLVDQASVSMVPDVLAGLAVTSHNNGAVCSAEFSNVSVEDETSGYFTNANDVGSPLFSGSFLHTGGAYILEGGGSDIYGTSDHFLFASQLRSGDMTITARVSDVENTNTWAKAGIMIRETLAANSKEVAIIVRPDNRISMQYRGTTGGSTSPGSLVGDTTNAKWIRLVRTGDAFAGSYSIDGLTWIDLSSHTVAMASEVEVGLAVTSHNDATLCTATFTDVTID
ncbi:MAG: Ig-like domain-containing protein [Opitutaceae bacterium]